MMTGIVLMQRGEPMDLIDRKMAIDAIWNNYVLIPEIKATVISALKTIPSIQPLTRCKSCEYSVCLKADNRFCSNFLEVQKDG